MTTNHTPTGADLLQGDVRRFAFMSRASHWIDFEGEPFEVLPDRDTVFIRHTRSSLIGTGRTLAEAEFDVRVEAGVLVTEFPDLLREMSLDLEAFCWRICAWPKDRAGKCRCRACRHTEQE